MSQVPQKFLKYQINQVNKTHRKKNLKIKTDIVIASKCKFCEGKVGIVVKYENWVDVFKKSVYIKST